MEAAIRHGDIPVILLTYDDDRDALAAVAEGNADAAIGPDVSMLPLVQRQYRDKLFVSGGLPDTPYALSIATRSDLPVLASILDKSLASIPARDAEQDGTPVGPHTRTVGRRCCRTRFGDVSAE